MKKATGILELSKQSHDVLGTFAEIEEFKFKDMTIYVVIMLNLKI